MSKNLSLKKIDQLKKNLLDMYIIDGVIVGKSREEIETLIEEMAKYLCDRTQTFSELLEEPVKVNDDAVLPIIITNPANGEKLALTPIEERIGHLPKRYLLCLELKTEEFLIEIFKNPYLMS
ncbi:MAG: hypothetical protein N2513_10125 [Deltaproteobacteria bacterium]|nr:hypothetical protein [Deltaproteobacteria bacterium]